MIRTSPKWGSVLRVVRLATGGCTVTWSRWLLKVPCNWILRQFHSEVLEYEMIEALNTPEWEQAFMFAANGCEWVGDGDPPVNLFGKTTTGFARGFTRKGVVAVIAADVSLPKERLGIFQLTDGTFAAITAWGLHTSTNTITEGCRARQIKTSSGVEIHRSWVKGGRAVRADTLEKLVLRGLKVNDRTRLEDQLPDHIVSLHLLQTEEELKHG